MLCTRAFFLFCFLPAAWPQDTTATGPISGVVKRDGGQPAPGAQVCVQDTNRCAVTGVDGTFRIPEIRAGIALLSVTIAGQPALKNIRAEMRPLWREACAGGVADVEIAQCGYVNTGGAAQRGDMKRVRRPPATDYAKPHLLYLDCTEARVAPVEMPPSTSNVCPLTYRLSSEERNTTAPSRSFGWPGRLTGMRSFKYSSHSWLS